MRVLLNQAEENGCEGEFAGRALDQWACERGVELHFIEPGKPIPSPEAAWLRGEAAVVPVDRSGPVTVWKVRSRLDPSACGPSNAPLHKIPQQPAN